MPPGSPGTYRKKSASVDLAPTLQHLPRPRGSISSEGSKMAEDKPWPNNKDGYELKEVIGKLIYCCLSVGSTYSIICLLTYDYKVDGRWHCILCA